MVELTGVYDPVRSITTWTLPYADPNTNFTVVESTVGNQILNSRKSTGTTIEADGDYSGTSCFVGINYTMRYRFSEWYLKGADEAVANVQGRLQIRSINLSFTDTGYFRLEITPLRRETLIHHYNTGYSYMEQIPPTGEPITDEYTGVVVGVSTIGKPSLISGDQKFLVMSNAHGIKLDAVNDSYMPSEFQSASYEGFYTIRSRTV
jgi:hypothetical protein